MLGGGGHQRVDCRSHFLVYAFAGYRDTKDLMVSHWSQISRLKPINTFFEYCTSPILNNVARPPFNTFQHCTQFPAGWPGIDTAQKIWGCTRHHFLQSTQTSMNTTRIQTHGSSFWTERAVRRKMTRYTRRRLQTETPTMAKGKSKVNNDSGATLKLNTWLPTRSPAQQNTW